MWEQWALEILFAFGRMFYNPLFYWVLLLVFITGTRRVKRERTHFGIKIYDHFSEITEMWLPSLIFGILLSLVSLSIGFVFSYEILFIIALATILLSITGSLHLLSATYTLGITFLMLMLLPFLPIDFIDLSFIERLTNFQYVTIAFLIGIFLFIEALLIQRAKQQHTYPLVTLSKRGVWLGEQEIKRMAVIPFLVLIPKETSLVTLPLFPYFHIGDTAYQLVVFPLLIGFQYLSRTEPIETFRKRLANQKFLLAAIVLTLVFLSYYVYPLAIVSVIIAILGNEWFTYKNRLKNQYEKPLFSPMNEGVKVLGTIPGSRAEELGILPGETIVKVNGHVVNNSQEFYKYLQQSGAFFKLDIIDLNGEVRFIQSAFYAEDHHGLGVLFPERPYTERQRERANELKVL